MISYVELTKITRLFVLFKLIQFLIIYLTPLQFDTSTSILINFYSSDKSRDIEQILEACNLNVNDSIKEFIEKHVFERILDKLVVWDGVYFLKSTISNPIGFEHEWVFAPLLWRLINFLNFKLKENFYVDVLIGLALSNCCHYLSCLTMYELTCKTFRFAPKQVLINKRDNFKYNFPYICAILTIIQPSGIFSTSVCPESPTQFLCYLALTLREGSLSSSLNNGTLNSTISSPFTYILSGCLFTLAYGFRSNSLFYGIVYLDDLYKILITYKKRDLSSVLLNSITIIVSGSILGLGLLYSIYLPYSQYCTVGDRGEWCANKPLPWLIPFAQNYYWNNGFLNYFTLNNLPNFLIALPSLVIVLLSLVYFHTFSPILNTTNTSGIWKTSCFYLFLQFTLMHVQIINRVMTFIPFHIWYVGYLITMDEFSKTEKGREDSKTGYWIGKVFANWWIIWVLVQTGLYGSFLPPA